MLHSALNLGRKRFIFAGGGTGGHLYPAIALAEEVSRRVSLTDILFVGTARGLESQVLPQLGWPLRKISVRGLRRKVAIENLLFPIWLVLSVLEALVLLRQFKPKVVVGTGGYVSGPVLFAAWLLQLPRLIQEQNVRPGVTTRLLAELVDEVHLSFPESTIHFRTKYKLRVTGNPVRRRPLQLSTAEARKKLGLLPNTKTILIFGGSQGAHSINAAVMLFLNVLMQQNEVQLIWGTGIADYEQAKSLSNRYARRVWVKPYIEDMPIAYRASDMVVCRAGAITLSEIELFGLPAILIPYPFASAGHQEWNARMLVKHGAARMILDAELSQERLLSEVTLLLDDDRLRKDMSRRMIELARPDATKIIADSILELAARYDVQTRSAGPHG